MKYRVPKGVEKRTPIKTNEKPQTLVSLPAARFHSRPPQPCLAPKNRQVQATASTTGCSESPALSPKHLPEAWQTSPAVSTAPRSLRTGRGALRRHPSPHGRDWGKRLRSQGFGGRLLPCLRIKRHAGQRPACSTARRGSSLQERAAPAICFEVLDLQTGQGHCPVERKPSPETWCKGRRACPRP